MGLLIVTRLSSGQDLRRQALRRIGLLTDVRQHSLLVCRGRRGLIDLCHSGHGGLVGLLELAHLGLQFCQHAITCSDDDVTQDDGAIMNTASHIDGVTLFFAVNIVDLG